MRIFEPTLVETCLLNLRLQPYVKISLEFKAGESGTADSARNCISPVASALRTCLEFTWPGSPSDMWNQHVRVFVVLYDELVRRRKFAQMRC